MRHLLLAAAGGALGAGARHIVNTSMLAWFGPGFPWATLTVNVVGSLLMGVLIESLMPLGGGSAAWRIFLATGILGGFTTFSAFSLDAWVLYERGQHLALGLYVTLSIILSIAALNFGMALVRGLR
jgi:CrcB protein